MPFTQSLSDVALPTQLSAAKKKLWDRPKNANDPSGLDTDSWLKKEIPALQLYLNYAVTNLQEQLGLGDRLFNPEKIRHQLAIHEDDTPEKRQAKEDKLFKTANFLWLFQEDNPKEDFGESYQKYTIDITIALFNLRNAFCHPDRLDANALCIDRELHHFLTDYLYPKCIQACSGNANGNTAKLFKNLSVLQKGFISRRDVTKLSVEEANRATEEAESYNKLSSQEKDRVHQNDIFHLTRRGIIFLVCMALYKDDATEFCQCLTDMRIPPRMAEWYDEWEVAEWQDFDGKAIKRNVNKLCQEVFTYLSYRRGRTILDGDNQDFLCFADILNYLNKTPSVSLKYLSLMVERQKLQRLYENSQEDEETKRTKYLLHRRAKERFLTMAAGACEDFDWLPAMRFKRLDISEYLGRKRYCYGKENDNAVQSGSHVRMDRHFIIRHDAIRFEYKPQAHYGAIRIDSLRSHVSEQELKRLLVLREIANSQNVDNAVEAYFAAYHKVLETMLNAPVENGYVDRTPLLNELSTITGAKQDLLMNDETFRQAMTPYFPANLVRFFIPEENRPTKQQLLEKLKAELQLAVKKDNDFLAMLEEFKKWRDMPEETRPPRPRTLAFNDNTLTQKIFDLLNLFLTNEHKFRQLPFGQKHRGYLDVEYQDLHRKIGRFGKDTIAFWAHIQERGVENEIVTDRNGNPILDRDGEPKMRKILGNVKPNSRRPEIHEIAAQLEKQYNALFGQYRRQLQERPVYTVNGAQVRAMPDLKLLAQAAVQCHREVCQKFLQVWSKSNIETCDEQVLLDTCRRFGIRTGLTLDYKALLQTILKIDEEKWVGAFDYEKNQKWQGRDLTQNGHIVTQIPFANGFADRNFAGFFETKRQRQEVLTDKGTLDFSKCQKKLEQKLNKALPLSLRDFYGTQCLVNYAKTKGQDPSGTSLTAEMPEEHRGLIEDFRSTLVDKAIREIKNFRCQDLLLLDIATQYRERFLTANAFADGKGITLEAPADFQGDIYDFYENLKVVRKVKDYFRVRSAPNDLLRPVYAQICDSTFARILAEDMTPEERNAPCEFHGLVKRFRELQAKGRSQRIAYAYCLNQLECMVVHPDEHEYNGLTNEQKRTLEFPCYRRAALGKNQKRFTQDDYNFLADVHGKIYHKNFMLSVQDCQKLDRILKFFGIRTQQL